MEKVKQYDFITVTYDEAQDGTKTIKKMRFFGSSKHEFKVEGNIELDENDDGKINTFGEIVKLLQGLPEGSNLKAIIDNIDTSSLTEEEKEALNRLVYADVHNVEEIYYEQDGNGNWKSALKENVNIETALHQSDFDEITESECTSAWEAAVAAAQTPAAGE